MPKVCVNCKRREKTPTEPNAQSLEARVDCVGKIGHVDWNVLRPLATSSPFVTFCSGIVSIEPQCNEMNYSREAKLLIGRSIVIIRERSE